MWLSKQMRQPPPTADADLGVTTIAGKSVGVFEALLLRRILAPFRSKLHVLGKSLTAAQHCGGNDK